MAHGSRQLTPACNDGNACTKDWYDAGIGGCVHDVIMCDDGDPHTLDTCDPMNGCKYFKTYELGSAGPDPTLTISSDSYFYEDQVTLTKPQITSILDWIKFKVTEIRIPFCWKQSYGRGAGEGFSACLDGKKRIGELCYSHCPAGYTRWGFDCHQDCLPGWTDWGLLCDLPEKSYTRKGYPWEIGDPVNNKKMFQRCEHDYGKGSCEECGLIVYPKCEPGYSSNLLCFLCLPGFPDCEALGYEKDGLGTICPKKIIIGDPTPMVCASGLEQSGLLCYEPCKPGYYGKGPVCWQSCDATQADCGAGCAKDAATCGLTIADQVIAPLIVAANIATLGLAEAPDTAIEEGLNAVRIGDKIVSADTKIGKALIWLANKLQTVGTEDLPKEATLLERIQQVQIGTDFKKLTFAGKVASQGYSAVTNYNYIAANNFADMTSTEIDSTLDRKLNPADAAHVKHLWAMMQFNEMAKAEAWQIAGTVLDAISLVDITGITGVVAAYAKPVCNSVIKFPNLPSTPIQPVPISPIPSLPHAPITPKTTSFPTRNPSQSPIKKILPPSQRIFPTPSPTEPTTSKSSTPDPTISTYKVPTVAPSTKPWNHTCDGHTCDDGNACTVDIYDKAHGVCVNEVIVCDDGDPSTFDTCDPMNGCKYFSAFNFGGTGVDPTITISAYSYFYDDYSALTQAEVSDIIDWIKARVTEIRVPLCLKQSLSRGNGVPLSACPEGKKKIGSYCYSDCPSGYSRLGVGCYQNCLPGWTDNGATCILHESNYGRGFGYDLMELGLCMSVSGIGCEECKGRYYPKCKPGYRTVGCNICQPNIPDCGYLGYSTAGTMTIATECPKKVIFVNATSLICGAGMEEDGSLCYRPCNSGFLGQGSECWQSCTSGFTECAGGCAKDSAACTNFVDQEILPLAVQSDINALEFIDIPDGSVPNGINVVRISGRLYASGTKIGRAMIWLANKLQSTWSVNMAKEATLLERIKEVPAGSLFSKLSFAGKVVSQAYAAVTSYNLIVANNFAEMTSPEIDSMLDQKLDPADAAYVKRLWAMMQFNEVAAAQGWQIDGTVLDTVSLVDITEISHLVAVYKEPICLKVATFPELPSPASSPIPISPIPRLPRPPTCIPTSSPTTPPTQYTEKPSTMTPSLSSSVAPTIRTPPPKKGHGNAPTGFPSVNPTRTLSPTKGPRKAPTGSPSVAPATIRTPFPKNGPGSAPTQSPSSSSSSSSGSTLTSAPSGLVDMGMCHISQATQEDVFCQKDVKAIEIVGSSGFNGLPISIIERSTTAVTFQIHQEWNSTGQVYVQYFDPLVRQYTCVNVCNKDNTFKIISNCMKSVPISIVEVWVETEDPNDNAAISSCCFRHGESLENKHFLEGTYEVRCVTLCETY